MIALMLPAALVFIFWTDPGLIRQPRRWVAPLLCAFIPLLLYLYLPIRGQTVTSLDGTFVPTLAGTLDWITARGYSIFPDGQPVRGGAQRQLDHRTVPGSDGRPDDARPRCMGLVTAWKFSRRRYVFLLLATLSQVAFASAYKVQDVEVFLPPAFMLTAVWAAWGLAPLFDGLALRGMNCGVPAASEPRAALADRRRLGGIPGRGDVVRAGEEHIGGLPGAESPDELGRL